MHFLICKLHHKLEVCLHNKKNLLMFLHVELKLLYLINKPFRLLLAFKMCNWHLNGIPLILYRCQSRKSLLHFFFFNCLALYTIFANRFGQEMLTCIVSADCIYYILTLKILEMTAITPTFQITLILRIIIKFMIFL